MDNFAYWIHLLLVQFFQYIFHVNNVLLFWRRYCKEGEYFLKVTEPRVSIVVIWDTSGSMKGRTEELQQAIEAYIDQFRPEDRVQLIRFHNYTQHWNKLSFFLTQYHPDEYGVKKL